MSNQKNKKSIIYPLGIALIFLIEYFFLVFLPYLKDPEQTFIEYIYLIVLHFSLFLLVWSYVMTYVTVTKSPPPFWGFYLNDTEQKKKRYCLICHVFKPERCHHCSTCNKCILVMDHHCPWLNGCVGHSNRKFFMMLLFYANTTVFLLIIGNIKFVYDFFFNKKFWYVDPTPLIVNKIV